MSDHAKTSPSDRTAVRRIPSRGVYDRDTIDQILDEALICHVGFVDGDQPFVMPTIHVRIGDQLFLHGSRTSRMLRCLATGAPACVTVTLLDGLVLARSAFHHSMNYRSIVILGHATPVEDEQEQQAMLAALVEHVIPGRWNDARQPTEKELRATQIVSIPINEASAKIRQGPPVDDDEDYDLPVWAGLIPLSLVAGTPEPDPRLSSGIAVPRYVTEYKR